MTSAAAMAANLAFAAPYAPDDAALIRAFIAGTQFDAAAERRIDQRATRLIAAIRDSAGGIGELEDFLREFALSTREGLALMVLAEALLRVPDAATQDRLIEDKIGNGDWSEHRGEKPFVAASIWALGLTSRIVQPGDTPERLVIGLVKRLGKPAVRTATRQAMRVLGHHFVLGQTIGEALGRARAMEKQGFRHSYDMLGEGARTAADAERYFEAYAGAIAAIGKAAGNGALPDRPGISVKLSALHPRYEAVKHERVLKELAPRLLDLARAAKAHDLNLTVDAEEADRLELSLEVVAAVLADPSLVGWDGFGLAIQAYQKRAAAVVDWVGDLAAALDRRLMVRLVKGAYWDTEVKRTQERGLADYPVFTRKPATDQSYLACAHRLLALRPRIYPQFASHNALTVAAIVELAGGPSGYEFQRLHGMGEALFAALRKDDPAIECRIYAPVGGHRELLAYLVRRLLENGANSSFVSVVGDADVPIETLLKRPEVLLEGGARVRHSRVPLPRDLYAPARRNSLGLEFGSAADLGALLSGMAKARDATVEAHPLTAAKVAGTAHPVVSPVDGKTVVGNVVELPVESIHGIMAAAGGGFATWSRVPASERAAVLDRLADSIESERDALVELLAREAGKTLNDGIAEVREAADFCRYYAAQARLLFAAETMPGPTGESDRLIRRGRGVFVCISPWNFPLAIFLGQVAAALAAGNAVVAKPAEQTPLIASLAFELLHKTGVPLAAAQLAPGDGKVGAALTAHADVAGVAFTGSTEVAWAINRTLAAKDGPIVPLIAETGGINAMIVDATALPEQVADDVVTSAFRSAGQRCSALRLLCLQEDVADRVLEMIVGAAGELALGNPGDPATDIGPVIDTGAKANLEAHIAAMRAAPFATFHFAGTAPVGGTFVAPHIIELDSPARLTREVFGPVLHVVRWKAKERDKLVAAIAATGYGLTLGIHSRIDETVQAIVDALPVGNVYVNRNMIGAVVGTQPFGGSGLSGTGPKAGGPDYLRRFALEQVISINTAAAGGNASLIAMEDE
jgi:RHH-type transcriptional regulator, proline utilization regulon repressor / proline dehydrogenase / delta 1-pyrroline-5-carboxylate dehydrogenase